MRRIRARLSSICTLTLLGIGALIPASVRAHGGPPAALGLVAANPNGAQVVLLNEGLALLRPEAWSYMCPRLWGEPATSSGKVPLARSADGVSTWVMGADDLYLLRDDMFVPQSRPELQRNNVIAVTNDAQNVYALHLLSTGTTTSTELIRLTETPEPPLWTGAEYWSSLTADATGLHLARVAGENELELVSVDTAGQELRRVKATLELTPNEIQLHATGGQVYVAGNDGDTWVLGYFDPAAGDAWHQILQGPARILGPQASADGTIWIALDGALTRLQGDMTETVGEIGKISCLDQWNDWQYACSGPSMYRLEAAGLGENFFGMQGFHAPDPMLVPPEAQDDCSFQWLLYTNDSRLLDGIMFVDWPMAAASSAGAAGQGGMVGPTAGSMSMNPMEIDTVGPAAAAGAGTTMAPAPPTQQSSGGCSVGSGADVPADGRSVLLSGWAFVALALCARARRRRLR